MHSNSWAPFAYFGTILCSTNFVVWRRMVIDRWHKWHFCDARIICTKKCKDLRERIKKTPLHCSSSNPIPPSLPGIVWEESHLPSHVNQTSFIFNRIQIQSRRTLVIVSITKPELNFSWNEALFVGYYTFLFGYPATFCQIREPVPEGKKLCN